MHDIIYNYIKKSLNIIQTYINQIEKYLPLISFSVMFDENRTGAVSIRCGVIRAISGSIFISARGGPPPVLRRACFSFVSTSR